jgi:hypothetical protein
VTRARLARVEAGEELVRALGFRVLRVRDHGRRARLEVGAGERGRAEELRAVLSAGLARLGFEELTKGRMAVLISHRFSTVRMADRILVLRGGELVEQGTHEELLAVGGLYSELFQLQAAGYR